jgi:hypothetical protein
MAVASINSGFLEDQSRIEDYLWLSRRWVLGTYWPGGSGARRPWAHWRRHRGPPPGASMIEQQIDGVSRGLRDARNSRRAPRNPGL